MVFLLLIFFMITTTFVTNPGIKVKLPQASAREMTREPRDLTVAVTKEGELIFRGEAITLDRLREELEGAAEANAETMVIIQADRKVPHGRVVKVMDAAKSAGLNKLGIATEAAPRR